MTRLNLIIRTIINKIKINFKKLEGKDVVVAGRIMAIRRMGKASFFRIIDNEGLIQVFIKKDDIGEKSYGNFKLFDIGDFVGVSGQVFKTKTGEKYFNILNDELL